VRTVDAQAGRAATNKRESRHADLIASRRAHVGGRLWVGDGAVRLHISKKSTLRERVRLAFADDEVIQQAHVDALQRTFQALSQAFIRG